MALHGKEVGPLGPHGPVMQHAGVDGDPEQESVITPHLLNTELLVLAITLKWGLVTITDVEILVQI